MAFNDNLEEYVCPICREILVKPVSLPCKHRCCQDCLEKTLDSNKYQCFLCRKFIGSWYRNAKRKNLLIDDKLWTYINSKYGDLVKKTMHGENIELFSERFPTAISAPGEIKQEFELSVEKIMKENRVQQQKEEQLSQELIKQIQEEEREYIKKQEELKMLDEEIARNLAAELNSEKISEIDEFDVQLQLSKDERLAKELAKLEQSSSSPKISTVRSSPKNRTPSRRVNNGPMDRFLEKKRRY